MRCTLRRVCSGWPPGAGRVRGAVRSRASRLTGAGQGQGPVDLVPDHQGGVGDGVSLVLALGVVAGLEGGQLGAGLLQGAGGVGPQPGLQALVGSFDLALGLGVAHASADGAHAQGCQPPLGAAGRTRPAGGVQGGPVAAQQGRGAPPVPEGGFQGLLGALVALTAPEGLQGGDDPAAVVDRLVDGHRAPRQAPLDAVELPQLVGTGAGEPLPGAARPLAGGRDDQAQRPHPAGDGGPRGRLSATALRQDPPHAPGAGLLALGLQVPADPRDSSVGVCAPPAHRRPGSPGGRCQGPRLSLLVSHTTDPVARRPRDPHPPTEPRDALTTDSRTESDNLHTPTRRQLISHATTVTDVTTSECLRSHDTRVSQIS